MRIVIDMQGAQTESRFRGIGRYTLSFVKAIARNKGEHEVVLALNGLFKDTIEPIRTAFNGLLPQKSIRIWQTPGPVMETIPGNNIRRRVAEIVREAFLESLDPDIIHISSCFEGYVDDGVTSIGQFDRSTAVSVSLYDLIPLLNPDHYLKPNTHYAKYYETKVGYLKQARVLLSISESSRQEGLKHLALPNKSVVNISTAIEPRFQPLHLESKSADQLRLKFGITRSFVFYTGGADERKNLPRLIQAFSSLPSSLRASHQLLLSGKIPEGNITQLQHFADSCGLNSNELLFIGYITDEELIQLYNLCKLFVFPSWHEGFGLPVLEAMSCGAPVICSKTSSLPEVIGLEDALFDPFDQVAIHNKMKLALEDGAFRTNLRKHGLQRARQFSWDESAKRAIEVWENLHTVQGKELKTSHKSWKLTLYRLAAIYNKLVQSAAMVAARGNLVSDIDLRRLSLCIDRNEQQFESFLRAAKLPKQLTWRIEGPFDSSYSLALVNREMARALAGLGHKVVLHSTEGPGDFPANERFLMENSDLAHMHLLSAKIKPSATDVTSRNLYPPRAADMHARINIFHAYGWEESGFPQDWVESFNLSLQGLTVMSEHVRKVMIDNGVTVPLAVSGIGVDHWDRIKADIKFCLNAREFRFLHVSSCFPRKGADIMLAAYGCAFRAEDNVTLVIKTFKNPHNEIHRWLEEARDDDPDFPDVRILEGDYTDPEMKALYEQCHALVAPSRAEGFGLPMAEAMLSGLSVITTAWSGTVDFCTRETSWLVDYQFEPADTHIGMFSSVWAAPNISHLSQIMREVYETPKNLRDIRNSAGCKLLRERFSWSKVAERTVKAVRVWSQIPEYSEPRIGWITTWNTRCGIATYSKHLVSSMPSQVMILAAHTQAITCEDQANVERCWSLGDQDSLLNLKNEIEKHRLDILVLQFNYGFFNLHTLADFLIKQIEAGRIVFIMMHSTIDPVHSPEKKLSDLVHALSQCHRVLVHATSDLNRLKEQGLVSNVALFPHGILNFRTRKDSNLTGERFTVASYGFFLPHKGLLELIEAVSLLKERGLNIQLLLINSEYPAPESGCLIKEAKQLVKKWKLERDVIFHHDFLSDNESLQKLMDADLIVFPYKDTSESASGAVRYGLATGRPVAVSPITIFEDIKEAVHYLPGHQAEHIANGIAELKEAFEKRNKHVCEKEISAHRWCDEHAYSKLGLKLYNIIKAIHQFQNTIEQDNADD